jgi:hypothetical protein
MLRDNTAMETVALDLNLMIYRDLVSRPLTLHDTVERDRARQAFIESFFAEEFGALESVTSLTKIIAMIDRFDMAAINETVSDAVSRMTGVTPINGKAQYVEDQQIINAALNIQANRLEAGARLELEPRSDPSYQFTVGVNAILGEKTLLWRWLDEVGERLFTSYDAAVILIDDWCELHGGLIAARWIKNRLGKKVIITGGFRQWVHVEVFRGLLGDCYDRFAKDIIEIMVALNADCSSSACQEIIPGFAPHGDMPYFSPFPVVGARIASRCYWAKCGFCGQAGTPHLNYVQMSDENIRKSMENLPVKDGRSYVQYLDYALSPKHLDTLVNVGGSVHWAAQIRFERHGLRDGFFAELYNSGCRGLSFGFETGSEKLLSLMRKGGAISRDSRIRQLRHSAEAGIRNHLFIITGLPGESDDDFADTLGFIHDALDYISSVEIYPYQHQPGTPIFDRPHDFMIEPNDRRVIDRVTRLASLVEDQHLAEARATVLTDLLIPWMGRTGAMDYLEGHAPFRGLPGWP